MADRDLVLAILLDELTDRSSFQYFQNISEMVGPIITSNVIAASLAADVELPSSFFSAGSAAMGDKHVTSPQKRKSTELPTEASAAKKVNNSNEAKKPVFGKITMNIGGATKKPGITMNLGPKKTNLAPVKIAISNSSKEPPVVAKTGKVASVFNEESESDDEEMPIEAKMKMRNVGRETPTAAGPNSFGKGNLGFCDRTKMIERDLKRQMQELGERADGK